ncbi:MAG: hypothetical protein RID53_28950 [Coleofasciculus sp. B1-GNL1-01]|uniref:hypothetical protein n=1 Tax=Coleofasciculus sp. B1-GNL1-01 TaxID=3068484 RepID=UPI0032FE5363
MPQNSRLLDLNKNLQLLYEKLAAMERSRITAYDAEAKISIEMRIREEIIPDIRRYEAEYWQVLSQEFNALSINEIEANNVIIEVTQTIEQITKHQTSRYPDEIIHLLLEIRDKLREPDKSSTAKLKATLPLLPPFVSYEIEFGTQDILQQFFPTFSRLLNKTKKK